MRQRDGHDRDGVETVGGIQAVEGDMMNEYPKPKPPANDEQCRRNSESPGPWCDVCHRALPNCKCFATTYAEVAEAMTSGKYVRWVGPRSKGFVLAVKDPESLVLTTCGGHLPFKSGFAQAIALGYTFEVNG